LSIKHEVLTIHPKKETFLWTRDGRFVQSRLKIHRGMLSHDY